MSARRLGPPLEMTSVSITDRGEERTRHLTGETAYSILVSLMRSARTAGQLAARRVVPRGEPFEFKVGGMTVRTILNYNLVVDESSMRLTHPDGDCGCQHKRAGGLQS